MLKKTLLITCSMLSSMLVVGCSGGSGSSGGSNPNNPGVTVNSVDSCPIFTGSYKSEDGKMRMEISSIKSTNGVNYNFGEGSETIIADSKEHSLPDSESGSYKVTCESDSVKVVVSQDGKKVGSMTYLKMNTQGDLRYTSEGFENLNIVFIKQ